MERNTIVVADALRQMYWEEMLTPGEIAKRLGISRATVSGRMQRAGIPFRSRSDAQRLARAQGYGIRPTPPETLRSILRCPSCAWAWRPQANHAKLPCPMCGHITEARIRRGRVGPQGDVGAWKEQLKAWREAGDPRADSRSRRAYARMRRTALLIVGRGVVKCVSCGCDDDRLLEINHVNGNGRQDPQRLRLYRVIARLARPVDDLNLLCRVCNALDHLRRRFGELPFAVSWAAEKTEGRRADPA